MLKIHFQGWYQVRLATDPDPFDEKRGISGPTCALPGEPDLDRIIRLQDPVAARWPMEKAVGVNVYRVTLDDLEQPGHPLLGARVELLDDPVYEGRNWAVAHGGSEPIDPFHLQISGGGVSIRRQDLWDPADPGATIFSITPAQMARRQPVALESQSATVADATGIVNYQDYRRERKEQLKARLQGATDPMERLGLEKRIGNLEKDATIHGITTSSILFLGARMSNQFEINGPVAVSDPDNRLGGKIGTSQLWPIEFWAGGYDVDTLMAYMRGRLDLPFYPVQR